MAVYLAIRFAGVSHSFPAAITSPANAILLDLLFVTLAGPGTFPQRIAMNGFGFAEPRPTGSIYLRGTSSRKPHDRPPIRAAQPEYYKFLGELFDPEPADTRKAAGR